MGIRAQLGVRCWCARRAALEQWLQHRPCNRVVVMEAAQIVGFGWGWHDDWRNLALGFDRKNDSLVCNRLEAK